MAGQMGEAQSDLMGLQDRLLGPDYNYSKYIVTPPELGMSADGNFDALTNDISGLMAYVKVLITGQGKGSRTGGPLGNKFFLETPSQCTDKATDEKVTRSIYINNVPDGSIPFITQGMGGKGITFDRFEGLVPGLMSNLAQINPLQILQAFTSGDSPTCQAITMEVISANNVKSTGTGYVTNSDISLMNDKWFPGGVNPYDTSEPTDASGNKQPFTTMQGASSLINERGTPVNFNKMPNDFFVRLYYTSLGLLGLYFFLRMVFRRRLRLK